MPTSNNQNEDLSTLFGLDELSEEEQEDFLADIGSTLMESAVLTFLLSLDEAGQRAFESFLKDAGEGEAMIQALAETYPEFLTVLDEEMVRFREEAKAMLGAAA